MKKRIIGIIICIILLIPLVSITAVSNEPWTMQTIRGEHQTNLDETELVTCDFYGIDGKKISCKKEIPKSDAEQLRNQLKEGSKAFVTMHSADASDEEIIEAEEIVGTTLTMMDDLGVIPEGLSVDEAKQLLYLPINKVKRSTILGVIGSAGVGLLRPIHPSILPKVVIFWAYAFGATFSLGLNLFKAKLGPQFGFALFFIGLVLSIGITGTFFGFTPFAFYI